MRLHKVEAGAGVVAAILSIPTFKETVLVGKSDLPGIAYAFEAAPIADPEDTCRKAGGSTAAAFWFSEMQNTPKKGTCTDEERLDFLKEFVDTTSKKKNAYRCYQYFGDGTLMGTNKDQAIKKDTEARRKVARWAVKEVLVEAWSKNKFEISSDGGELKKVTILEKKSDEKFTVKDDESGEKKDVAYDKFRKCSNNDYIDEIFRRYRGEVGLQTMGNFREGDMVIKKGAPANPLKIIGLSDDASMLKCQNEETGTTENIVPTETKYWEPEPGDYVEIRIRQKGGGYEYHCAKVLQVDIKRQVLKFQYMKVDDLKGWVPEEKEPEIRMLQNANPNGATIRACIEKEKKRKAEENRQMKENKAKTDVCKASGFSGQYKVILPATQKSVKLDAKKCYATFDIAKEQCCRNLSTCKSVISKSASSKNAADHCWSDYYVPEKSESDGTKQPGAWLVYIKG